VIYLNTFKNKTNYFPLWQASFWCLHFALLGYADILFENVKQLNSCINAYSYTVKINFVIFIPVRQNKNWL